MAEAVCILCAAAAAAVPSQLVAAVGFPLAHAVYILCAATALACAWLLIRGYARSRARFLLWSSLCFVGLALNNLLLFADFVVVRQMDLSLARGVTALVALSVLVFGLVWESP